MLRRMLCLVILMAFAVPVMAQAVSKGTIYTNYRLRYVKLRDMTKKDRKTKKPTHPTEVSVNKVREMLASVNVSRRAFSKKKKPAEKEIFDQPAIDLLSPHIVDALRQASNDQVVIFSYLYKNPQHFFRNDRFTSAKIWVEGNDFHIEFLKLYARLTGDTTKRGYTDRIVNKSRGIRIVLDAGPGQRFGTTTDELVLDMNATHVAAGGKHSVEQFDAPTERLEELKRLLDMKLITKDEYDAKRQVILNQL